MGPLSVLDRLRHIVTGRDSTQSGVRRSGMLTRFGMSLGNSRFPGNWPMYFGPVIKLLIYICGRNANRTGSRRSRPLVERENTTV